jgi:GNAT superfamily N-acetyltransferase
MPVRLATPQDEPAIGAVCTAAFFEEELFGQLIHPHRYQYPDDVKIYWHLRTRKAFQDPRKIIVVATVTEDGAEKIIGQATWERQGDDEGAQKLIQERSLPCEDVFTPLPSTNNRAIDPSKMTILHDTSPFFKHHWEGSTNGLPRSTNWYLNLCCVDPAYQKRGLGYQLVHWGLDRARAEKIHASVTTSLTNEAFYLRCGFDEIVGNCGDGEGNPLRAAGIKGGDILWMWAKDSSSKTEA